MAVYSLGLWWVVAVLLLWSPHAHSREVTHEDIRDAMLSLVHMFRSLEDKLERHESREKAMGDKLHNSLKGLDKKHTLEALKGMISRLDERLSNVETILFQKEEREKTTQNKANEMLDSIQKSLQSLTNTVTKNFKTTPLPHIEENLTTNDDTLERRLDVTDAKLDALKKQIESLKSSLSKDSLRAMCLEVASDVNPLEKHISEAEKLLTKYELKLSEYNTTKTPQTDFVTLNEVSLADEAWHNKMTEVMERQEKEVRKIQRLLSDAESMWKDLPRLSDLHTATNQTLEAVESSRTDLIENDDKSVSKVAMKLRELSERLVATNQDIQSSLTQGNTMTERAYNDVFASYETLRREIETLTKNDQVLLETADNVIANKKSIQYGVHQITVEVGEKIKQQARDLSKSINDRFEDIESRILANQTRALTNLTTKIETEMSQVWHQIGVMYQQLSASKQSLDKISEQTEQYVNSSATTMDRVTENVGLISARMVKMDDDLNYLLGRTSIVTQEFTQIKTELNNALEKVKKNSTAKKDDEGPGPHNITSAEST